MGAEVVVVASVIPMNRRILNHLLILVGVRTKSAAEGQKMVVVVVVVLERNQLTRTR